MLKTPDGRGPVHFGGLVENPLFYYRKQMNYICILRERREGNCWNICFILEWCKIDFKKLNCVLNIFLKYHLHLSASLFPTRPCEVEIKMVTCACFFCAKMLPELYFCLQRKHLHLEKLFFFPDKVLYLHIYYENEQFLIHHFAGVTQ